MVIINIIFLILIIYSFSGIEFYSNESLKKFITKRNIIRSIVIMYMVYYIYFWLFSEKSHLYALAYIYALAMLCISQLALNFNSELALFFNQNSKLKKKIQIKTNLSDLEKFILDFYSSSEDFFFDLFRFLFRLISFLTILLH